MNTDPQSPGKAPLRTRPAPRPKRRPTSELSIPTGVELIGDGRYVVRTCCSSWAYFVHTYALDLADGGVFVECLCPPVPGSIVELRIALPEGAKDLAVEGEVVTVREPAEAFLQGAGPGFGMQLRISDDNRKQLRQIIDQAQSTSVSEMSPTGTASASSTCLRLFVPHAEIKFIAELEQELREIKSATEDRIRLGLPDEFDSEMAYLAFYARTQHWKTKAEAMKSPEIPGLVERIVDILQQACARLSAVADVGPTEPASKPQSHPAPVPTVVAEAPSRPMAVQASVRDPAPATPIVPSVQSEPPRRHAPSKREKQRLQATLAQVKGKMPPKPAASSAAKMVPPPPPKPKLSPKPAPKVEPESEEDDPLIEVREQLRSRRYDEALSTLRAALQRDGSGPRANTWRVWISFIEARLFAARKDYPAAVEKYEEVLKLDPNHPAAQREVLMARCMLK